MRTGTPGTERGYFDHRFNAQIINVAPGEQALANAEGEVLSTVLGSCVAACLRDAATGIGGMNHFLLPGDASGASGSGNGALAEDLRFGVASMEFLINALIKRGANRGRLEAKVFGGATMMSADAARSVGSRNAAFVLQFLDSEGIRLVAKDLGGATPRRANYEPATGRAWVNHLSSPRINSIAASEESYRQSIFRRDPLSNLEVF